MKSPSMVDSLRRWLVKFCLFFTFTLFGLTESIGAPKTFTCVSQLSMYAASTGNTAVSQGSEVTLQFDVESRTATYDGEQYSISISDTTIEGRLAAQPRSEFVATRFLLNRYTSGFESFLEALPKGYIGRRSGKCTPATKLF